MAFEPVKRKGGQPINDVPTVRISPDRAIASFNTKAMEYIGDRKYVIFLFDAETRELAIEPTAAPGEYAFSVSRSKSNGEHVRGTVSISTLSRVHRIEGAQTLALKESGNGRWLVADVGPALSD